ncbi:MAG: thioredoxin domain-containing protein, partial [Bradyrhizobium sp.]|nr:thioredoxin domain-containing protein [Bradyrhizobium sp.]
TVTASSPEEQRTDSDSLHVRGSASAPATLEIYGDFQCPSCALTSAVIGTLEKDYGPRLRVIFREFPLAMHEHALEAAMAAEAAGLQGQFWEMHDMLYQYQEVWSRASKPGRFFNTYAQSLGLEVERFGADANSDQTRARIMAEGAAGQARGVRNTPTIFVNGVEIRGVFTRDNLQAAIDAALAGKKKS